MKRSPAVSKGSIGCLLLLFASAGCSHHDLSQYQPQVDISPVQCGLKWFQSGYSPVLERDCGADRSTLHREQLALARADAWRIARLRCPVQCPPVELQDSIPTAERLPEGVCRDGVVYYTSRIFAQCR